MFTTRIALLIWASLINLIGIYFFLSGLLLTRVPLSEHSACSYDGPCSLKPTHKRAVILVIDSLRFDFIAPDPPTPPSPYYHNVLTLPRELTESRPEHSFIFNAFADPPATTLQRVKAFATGSLPTFVDMTNNFDATSIAEDSLLNQINLAGKRAAFIGDDTWLSVFPSSFEPNMSFPYGSWNVEDIHSGDAWITSHLIPLLSDPRKPFDLFVAHFPGVDHVGHRVGPDHPNMRSKLEQMNGLMAQIVNILDDETLLVLLGDHGMDRAGEHVGGSGTLETSTALWIYSKGPALKIRGIPIPSDLLRNTTFPNAPTSHRTIQQIDLLPTIALLLGLPIPFNNIGTVIPELFSRPMPSTFGFKNALNRNLHTQLEQALSLNALQVHKYLSAYRTSPSGHELDDLWEALESSWSAIDKTREKTSERMLSLTAYTRTALSACRSVWAQFDELYMSLGLTLLLVGLFAYVCAFRGLSNAINVGNTEKWLSSVTQRVAAASVLGILIGKFASQYLPGARPRDWVLFVSSLSSCIPFFCLPLSISSNSKSLLRMLAPSFLPILQALSFHFSFFTFWESRVAPLLLLSSLSPYVLTGLSASGHRRNIFILLLVIVACVKVMAMVTVCREEQHPYCTVTFYSVGGQPPLWAIFLSFPSALMFLLVGINIQGIVKPGFSRYSLIFALTPVLALGTACWVLEYVDSLEIGGSWSTLLRHMRTWAAWAAVGWMIVVGGMTWLLTPTGLDISTPVQQERLNSASASRNTFGARYFLFWTLILGMVWTSSQLPGQIVLAAFGVSMLAWLEVLKTERNINSIQSSFSSDATATKNKQIIANGRRPPSMPISFSEITPIALMGIVGYFGTGHEATFTSIRWKTAFVLVPTFEYPWAPVTVALNTFGTFLLTGVAAPLIGIWWRASQTVSETDNENQDPQRCESRNERHYSAEEIRCQAALTGLGMMIYYHLLLLGTAVGAAMRRNHTMAWKVFVPRFMLGVASCATVDVGVLIGVGLGVETGLLIYLKDMKLKRLCRWLPDKSL